MFAVEAAQNPRQESSQRKRAKRACVAMAHSEMVVYDAALYCIGCGASSKQKPWGRMNVFRDRCSGKVLEKKPVGTGCAECRETFAEAALPGTSSWEEEMQEDSAKASLSEHVERRRGQPSHFEKHSHSVETQYRTIWQDEYEAVDASEMKQRLGANALLRSGVQVDVVTDSQGQPREVILCPTGALPKVLVQTIVTHTHTEHKLRPETHLRQEQGAEFKAQMRETIRQEPQRRPMANRFSRQDLEARLGMKGTGPKSSGPSGSSGEDHNASRLAGLTAIAAGQQSVMANMTEPDAVMVQEEGVSLPPAHEAGVAAPARENIFKPRPKKRARGKSPVSPHDGDGQGKQPSAGKNRCPITRPCRCTVS